MDPSHQPPGDPASDRTVPFPPLTTTRGTYVSIEPLLPSHSSALYAHLGGPSNAALWTYLFSPPLPDQSTCDSRISEWVSKRDPQYYAVTPSGSTGAAGAFALMNIVPEHRRLEIGSIILGKSLQRTRAATETFYVVLKRAFEDLGYQRVEWKANALNKPSLAAAERLGFAAEGIFRKHMILKGKRRDTAWFSITDDEWPRVKQGFETWLSPDNFDDDGQQKTTLKDCRDLCA